MDALARSISPALLSTFLKTTCAQAIKNWEAKHEASAEMATEVVLCLQNPPIAKLDTKAYQRD
jgi:hypothetical protein